MCGGGGRVEDNSDKVAEIEAKEARKARKAQAEEEAKERARFNQQLSAAYSSSLTGAEQYFRSQGLDPKAYMPDIQSSAASRRSSIPDMAHDPGSYFGNLGQSVYQQLEEGGRQKALRDVNTYANTGFARELIPDTADDDIIASILGEKTSEAEQYVNNLLARGVVTDTGASAGMKAVGDQRFGVQDIIRELASAALEQGRGTIRDTATDAKTAAQQAMLGSSFDPFKYKSQIDDQVTEFMTSLGGRVRSGLPTDLFDFSKVLNKAGAGQGAQNTAFDPKAAFGPLLSGQTNNADEDDEENSPFPVF